MLVYQSFFYMISLGPEYPKIVPTSCQAIQHGDMHDEICHEEMEDDGDWLNEFL